ncbi:diguanylate cyclase (GGDEF) domain-containing protein [Sphingomonas gellani]|uniref:diguanylate cyclase n=1 Tax=Sphingomonas gellani TaxID=1166340 RepID=A0A1H8BIB5_9SPHN|nr:diguanylate cyclase [Sphingomonas gellani]SEM82219.1 diguanylate cyclase (GGDEF) domain-containing protein [Sphingomonas gellani]
MGRWIGFLCWLLVAATCLAQPAVARIPAGAVGQPIGACVARADVRLDARTLLSRPGHFDCLTPQRDFGSGDFDVLSGKLPRGAGQAAPAHLRFASAWQERVTVFAHYADGVIARVDLDGRGMSRTLASGAIFDVALPFRKVAVDRVLWRTKASVNTRAVVLAPTIATARESATSNLILAATYCGFLGIGLALLILNLALWFALKHGFQLTYCAMMAALMLYALSSSGLLAWLWPDIVNTDRMRINGLTLGAAAIAALLFARSFFEPEVFGGRTGLMARGIIGALVTTCVAYTVLAPWQARLLDRLYTCAFAALLVGVFVVLAKAYQKRSRFLWLFAFAWGAPIGFTALRVAAAFGLLRWSFWIDNSTMLAMTCEGLLSSLAIAYRIHLLSRERDEAREKEIAARMLADTDPLTGLLNRRAFLREAVGLPGDRRLVLIDIDHFKRINDTIGHDAGDEVLRIVARVLRETSEPGALVARLGGEEFAIVGLPGRTCDPERLLDALRVARMPFDLTVTASIGHCTGPLLREADWKLLYRDADRALYAAKEAGRDRARAATTLSFAA